MRFDLMLGIQALVPGAKVRGVFDQQTESEYNALYWLDPRPKPDYIDVEAATLKAVRTQLMVDINLKTSGIIVNTFSWKDIPAFMDLEFQFNMSQLFINKDMLTYPYEMKLSDDEDGCGRYINVVDADELATLYFTIFNHVATTLASGRALKDTLKTMNRTELEEFKDLR